MLEGVEPLPQRMRWELADEALRIAREVGNDRLVAFALMERANALRADDASAEVEQAAAALRGIGALRLLASLYRSAAYNAIKDGRHERARALIEQARPLVRQLGDPWMTCFFCGNEGLAALFTGDVDRARTAFEEQLRLCGELVIADLASEALGGLAAIATRKGDPPRAARLLGAASVGGAIGDADVTRGLEQEFFEAAAHAAASGNGAMPTPLGPV